MFALLPLALMLVTICAVVALAGLAKAPGRIDSEQARPWLRRMQLRAWLALAAALVAGSGFAIWESLAPGLGGLPLALLPGAAATAGLIAYVAVAPLRPRPDGRAAASLVVRRAWSYGSTRALLLPVLLAAGLIATLVITGVTSSADESGRHRVIMLVSGDQAGSAGPYPGWFYGVPLVAMTIAVVLAMGVALTRVATAPAPPVASLFGADEALRRVSSLVITRLTAAALGGYLGAVLFLAGRALYGVASVAAINGDAGHRLALTSGVVIMIVSAPVLLAAVGVATTAVLAVLRISIEDRAATTARVAA